MLCIIAMWRVVPAAIVIIVVSNLAAWAVEHVVSEITYRSGLLAAIGQLPSKLEFIQVQLLAWEVIVILVALGCIVNAYLYYLVLYPKFVRGGRDAIAFYAKRASHQGGCPLAGCKVAAALALLHAKS